MGSNTRLIKIESPIDLPTNIPLQMWQVRDEAEAAQIVGNSPAYLFKSKIIAALYLFVVIPEVLAIQQVEGAQA